jgi:hypothetical protein
MPQTACAICASAHTIRVRCQVRGLSNVQGLVGSCITNSEWSLPRRTRGVGWPMGLEPTTTGITITAPTKPGTYQITLQREKGRTRRGVRDQNLAEFLRLGCNFVADLARVPDYRTAQSGWTSGAVSFATNLGCGRALVSSSAGASTLNALDFDDFTTATPKMRNCQRPSTSSYILHELGTPSLRPES